MNDYLTRSRGKGGRLNEGFVALKRSLGNRYLKRGCPSCAAAACSEQRFDDAAHSLSLLTSAMALCQ
jgi:hypothetical protein